MRSPCTPDGQTTYHLPPEYHGDPVDPKNGALCYRYFGWRLLDELRDNGFAEAGVLSCWSLYNGLIGDQGMLIIYAHKARCHRT